MDKQNTGEEEDACLTEIAEKDESILETETGQRDIKIHIASFNVNSKPVIGNLEDWLNGDSEPPDIYAIGFQELDRSNAGEKENICRNTLKKFFTLRDIPFVEICYVRLIGVFLTVYVRKSHLNCISNVASASVVTMTMKTLDCRGGIGVRLDFHSTSICFVNCHLAPHTDGYEIRNQEVNKITEEMKFRVKRDIKLIIEDHYQVYWLGDLNYRVNNMNINSIKELLFKGEYDQILKNDQLNLARKQNIVFKGYSEGPINFHPTYKYDIGTDQWDSSVKQRAPAWCDRILWKGETITQLNYKSHPELKLSDHKPVSSQFISQSNLKVEVFEDLLIANKREGLPKLAVAVTNLYSNGDLEFIHNYTTHNNCKSVMMMTKEEGMDIYTWQWQSFTCTRPRHLILRREPPPPSARIAAEDGLLHTNNCTTTCNACKVTIHHHQTPGPRLRASCPFCGQPYSSTESPHLHGYVGVGGPGRQREERSAGDSLFRLPVINDVSPELRDNTNVARPLGEMSVTKLFVRPGAESPLPPISSESRRGSQTLSTPDLESTSTKSHLSNENISVASEMDDVPFVQPNYPVRNKTREEFLHEVRRAHQSENYTSMQRFYMGCFDSFAEICATFKVEREQNGGRTEDPDLKMDFIYAVHDTLRGMPSFIHKTVLKSIINALLEENRTLYEKDLTRAYFILIQNPVFASQSSYTILAHLLRQIVELPTSHHHLLVHWFKTLEVGKLRMIVRHVLQFITIRHFPPADKTLPPLGKCRWWISTATKALALINAANNSCNPSLLHYSEFYNSALDHIDLMQDYYNWQNPQGHLQFAYCQYPFILSIVAKRIILTKDSEQQMILTARRSLVAKVARHQAPQIDIFFLNIHVRRSHLVSDSLNEISMKQKDLKKKLKVSFVGEPGLDMGGLTKEWFLLLIRRIFHPDYGMFVYHPHSRCYWFSTDQEGNLREYNLIGVLMGLAVYNSIILDLHFPSVCYRKLLSPPVVPAVDTSGVGIVRHPTIEDLAEIVPDIAKGLGELLAYEGNVEEDMCMNFQVSLEEYGDIKTCKLKENGENIAVTDENREQYVQLYLDWILNVAIYQQFRAFYLGFHSVCASNALIMLRPEEVEMLVCGSPNLDLNELRKVTEYDGYKADDPLILEFWDVLYSLSDELKKKFLLFTTGSDRVPVGGMGEMTFKITRITNRPDNLPEAHTCFNQLVLPQYESRGVLREKLIIAISNAEGFGLE